MFQSSEKFKTFKSQSFIFFNFLVFFHIFLFDFFSIF